jgi:hypothetical protein
MNVVPSVARPRVAGKNHAHQAFFYRDRFTDFELRFVPAARDSSMWCLFQFNSPIVTHQMLFGPGAVET